MVKLDKQREERERDGRTASLCSVLGRNLGCFRGTGSGAVVIKPSDHKQTHADLTPHCNRANTFSLFLPFFYLPLPLFSLLFTYTCVYVYSQNSGATWTEPRADTSIFVHKYKYKLFYHLLYVYLQNQYSVYRKFIHKFHLLNYNV